MSVADQNKARLSGPLSNDMQLDRNMGERVVLRASDKDHRIGGTDNGHRRRVRIGSATIDQDSDPGMIRGLSQRGGTCRGQHRQRLVGLFRANRADYNVQAAW
ncbi:hypothetical protein LWC34_30340 [Kibdelosporangium philippinense]|uniref:Uncharacterized protein n=1 Tax=Kibdelosporangium philippinense TaxID=211113 RepID=A0ABS8ZGZ3_9PSEU|nr:hypothetical protein [Kibdelosporangium philippinense]MCE7007096.1 hypothetical protein [Kibdelosporangium philippinense]